MECRTLNVNAKTWTKRKKTMTTYDNMIGIITIIIITLVRIIIDTSRHHNATRTNVAFSWRGRRSAQSVGCTRHLLIAPRFEGVIMTCLPLPSLHYSLLWNRLVKNVEPWLARNTLHRTPYDDKIFIVVRPHGIRVLGFDLVLLVVAWTRFRTVPLMLMRMIVMIRYN